MVDDAENCVWEMKKRNKYHYWNISYSRNANESLNQIEKKYKNSANSEEKSSSLG